MMEATTDTQIAGMDLEAIRVEAMRRGINPTSGRLSRKIADARRQRAAQWHAEQPQPEGSEAKVKDFIRLSSIGGVYSLRITSLILIVLIMTVGVIASLIAWGYAEYTAVLEGFIMVVGEGLAPISSIALILLYVVLLVVYMVINTGQDMEEKRRVFSLRHIVDYVLYLFGLDYVLYQWQMGRYNRGERNTPPQTYLEKYAVSTIQSSASDALRWMERAFILVSVMGRLHETMIDLDITNKPASEALSIFLAEASLTNWLGLILTMVMTFALIRTIQFVVLFLNSQYQRSLEEVGQINFFGASSDTGLVIEQDETERRILMAEVIKQRQLLLTEQSSASD